jgi:hypothetical protein
MDIGVLFGGKYNATSPKFTADVENLQGMSIVGGTLDLAAINQSDSNIPQGQTSILKYEKSGSDDKLRLTTLNTVPDKMFLCKVKINIKFQGLKPAEVKSLYIIVWNDSASLVNIDSSNPLYLAIRNKYNTDYDLANETNFAIFKSHLLSLYGTFDLTQYSSVGSLIGNNQQSIFNYMPYITSINLEGCTNLAHRFNSTGDGFINVFDFTNMPRLTSISLKGCTCLNASNISPNTLSLATCPNVTSLDVEDTTIGVNIPSAHKISTLKLGSPSELIIGDNNAGITGLSLNNITI